MSDKQRDNVITWLPLGVSILTIIVGFSIAWGQLQAKQGGYDVRVSAVETKQDLILDKITSLEVNSATLTANVSFIKERLK